MASLIIDIEKRFTIPLGLPPLEIPTIPFPSFDFPELPDVVKLISDFIDFIGSLIPEPDISIDGLTIPSFYTDIELSNKLTSPSCVTISISYLITILSIPSITSNSGVTRTVESTSTSDGSNSNFNFSLCILV